MDILSILPKAHFPGTVYIGKNSLSFLRSLNGQRNLAVVSRSVWEKHGEKIRSCLQGADFFQFSSEPGKKDIGELQEKARGYENVIGIGGGSVMDLAKTARLAHEVGWKASADAFTPAMRLIMVPTTPGTGSEASRHSLIKNEAGEKEALTSEKLVPDVVLLDPGFLASLPASEVANGAMDILAHALEGLASRMSNPLTDCLALKAIDMVFQNAEKACHGDVQALESLQMAGFLAGIVQSSASVGAAHAFAHHFGPRMKMGHGKAVGIFLPEVLRMNMHRTDKYQKLGLSCTVDSSNLIQRLEELMSRCGFSPGLDASGIDMDDAAKKVRGDVNMRTNPFMLSEDDIMAVIEKVSYGKG